MVSLNSDTRVKPAFTRSSTMLQESTPVNVVSLRVKLKPTVLSVNSKVPNCPASKMVSEKNWAAAKAPLKTLIELYPDQSGPNNAFAMLAAVHRGLNEAAEERMALEKWAAQEADALDAYLRLMELGEAAHDWKAVSQNAAHAGHFRLLHQVCGLVGLPCACVHELHGHDSVPL